MYVGRLKKSGEYIKLWWFYTVEHSDTMQDGKKRYPVRECKGSVNFNGVTSSVMDLIYYNKMRFNQTVVRMSGDEVKRESY